MEPNGERRITVGLVVVGEKGQDAVRPRHCCERKALQAEMHSRVPSSSHGLQCQQSAQHPIAACTRDHQCHSTNGENTNSSRGNRDRICLVGELLACDQGLFCVVSHYMVGHDYTGFVSFETPENGMFWIELCVSMVRISTPQVLLTLLMTF